MERINLRAGSAEIVRQFPDQWGLLGFWQGEELLYLVKTSDLRRKLKRMLENDDTTSPVRELIHEADRAGFETYPDAVSSLIAEKIMLTGRTPLYNKRLQQSRDYVYLALDARRFPFIGIQDYTIEDWVYLGAFRSRFFVMDVIEAFSRLLRLPFCETGQYPCEKLDRRVCQGWCLNLAAEEGKTRSGENTLDKLEQLIKETYLYPQEAILNLFRLERQRYFDDLEFDKSEMLAIELGLLESYYDWVRFLHQAKEMHYETESFKVENGQLAWAKVNGREYRFAVSCPDYRPNELLALAKEMVDESRILYEYKIGEEETGARPDIGSGRRKSQSAR